MNFSSNSIRVLASHKKRAHLEPLIIRLNGPNTHSKKSHLVVNSVENMKRISQLGQQLDRSNKFYQEQIDNFLEESKVCQVELFQKLKSSQFSTIYRVRIKATGKHYALKKVFLSDEHESREEIICRKLRSNFIVKTIDIYKQTISDRRELNIMMELYDWNLKEFIKSEERIDYLIYKAICYQMARALFYIHAKGITHRDIKPENFLMKKNGRVVLCDFGSAKFIKKSQPSLAYLNSRSYRAPEMLLGSSIYTNSIDVWALACVMIELITKKEIFKGSSTLDCLLNISRVIGSKDLKRLKGNEQLTKLLPVIKGLALSEYLHEIGCPLLIDLLTKMLKIKSEERIRAIEILAHPFFDEIRDEQIYQEIMKEKLDISDFFTFSPTEIRNCQEYRTKIIPVWKRDRPDKHISTL